MIFEMVHNNATVVSSIHPSKITGCSIHSDYKENTIAQQFYRTAFLLYLMRFDSSSFLILFFSLENLRFKCVMMLLFLC